MTLAPTADGDTLAAAYGLNGFYRRGDVYPDGFPDLGLTDAHDVAPDYFDPVGVVDGQFGFGPGYVGWHDEFISNQTTWPPPPLTGYDVSLVDEQRVGQLAVYGSLGRDDNVEVGVQWAIDDLFGFFHQVSPAAWVDVEADDPEECGVIVNGDISLFYPAQVFYSQNLFRAALADGMLLDPAQYQQAGDGSVYGPDLIGSTAFVRLRCVDGYYQWLINDQALHAPVARPSWTADRDAWGLRILTIWSPTGEYYLNPAPPHDQLIADHETPAKVPHFYARPYDDPLIF